MINSNFNPKVSIVIPVYNCERYIREAVDSIFAQNYKNIEVIIVDDGSTDKTVENLQSLSHEFILIQQENAGQSAALTRGWQVATGEILGYLSADDSFYPELISSSIDAFKNPEVILTFPYFDLMDSNSLKLKTITPTWHSFEYFLSTLNNPIGPGVLFRKKLFIESEGWDRSYRQMQDLDFWLKICDKGLVIVIPKILAAFRVHNESRTFIGTSVEKASEPIRIVESFFKSSQSDKYSKLFSEATSSSYILSAQLHMRSGRVQMGLSAFLKGFLFNKKNIFKYRTLRIILNACFSRGYYVFIVPLLQYVQATKKKYVKFKLLA